MQKNSINTALMVFFLATAVMLIGGLAVIPALQEAEPTSKQNSILNRIPNLTVGGRRHMFKDNLFRILPLIGPLFLHRRLSQYYLPSSLVASSPTAAVDPTHA
jgi:hypothetical protein